VIIQPISFFEINLWIFLVIRIPDLSDISDYFCSQCIPASFTSYLISLIYSLIETVIYSRKVHIPTMEISSLDTKRALPISVRTSRQVGMTIKISFSFTSHVFGYFRRRWYLNLLEVRISREREREKAYFASSLLFLLQFLIRSTLCILNLCLRCPDNVLTYFSCFLSFLASSVVSNLSSQSCETAIIRHSREKTNRKIEREIQESQPSSTSRRRFLPPYRKLESLETSQ